MSSQPRHVRYPLVAVITRLGRVYLEVFEKRPYRLSVSIEIEHLEDGAILAAALATAVEQARIHKAMIDAIHEKSAKSA